MAVGAGAWFISVSAAPPNVMRSWSFSTASSVRIPLCSRPFKEFKSRTWRAVCLVRARGAQLSLSRAFADSSPLHPLICSHMHHARNPRAHAHTHNTASQALESERWRERGRGREGGRERGRETRPVRESCLFTVQSPSDSFQDNTACRLQIMLGCTFELRMRPPRQSRPTNISLWPQNDDGRQLVACSCSSLRSRVKSTTSAGLDSRVRSTTSLIRYAGPLLGAAPVPWRGLFSACRGVSVLDASQHKGTAKRCFLVRCNW